ncbi:type I polyketide synthase [Frankia sp. Cj3]|uniref:type I polyketide synthase n=1 Tax=Frankia sp. Cj3 TaxID=2880976 RepID=UPI001EF4C880|nr:type I polyketide synthase [Frankia sp. Cj3]
MTTEEHSDQSALLVRALRQLRDVRQRLREAQHARHEPIAVIGAGVRAPGGASDLDSLWRLLAAGEDAVSPLVHDVDGHRASADAGAGPQSGARGGWWGGMLGAVDGFDAEFFGMTATEAAHLDPQQRLVLEAAWESIEDAGLPAERLRERPTGVFLGLYGADYLNLQLSGQAEVTAYTAPGGAHSVAANRLSYLLDLRGPSLAVDTACSSSLIAVHVACRALRAHDCDYALVGGVNVILSEAATRMTEKVLPLAPGGRCRTFDAGAEGIVRAEGCGILLLQRACDAQSDGRAVRALIRGTAANHNGHANGLTAPSPRAQVELMRRALADGDADPSDVVYVEAHGTGTRLGDPIEAEALREVYGPGQRPCAVGSVKTNFGHQEAAAGVMGLLKAMLVLERGQVPPHLHLTRINPEIDLDGTRLTVPTAPCPLPAEPDGPRPLAAVSSFGFGGANAHVVLEAPPVAAPGPSQPLEPADRLLLPLSARSPGALATLASRFADRLAAAGDGEAAAICASAAVGRTHHSHRLAIEAAGGAGLAARLRDVPVDRVRPRDLGERRLAFIVSGQGSQWPGMGRGVLAAYPVVRAEVEACDPLIRGLTGWSALAELTAPEEQARLHRTEVAQVTIGVLALGLAAQWRAWGVEPHAVAGHSMGEIIAARLAGALERDEALGLLVRRAQLTEQAARGGRMASIALPADEVRRIVATDGGLVSVAAVNAPRSTVVSGERAAVERVTDRARALGAATRPLRVDYGFHSPLLAAAAGALTTAAPAGHDADGPALYSTVTGRRMRGGDLDGEHWARNLGDAVRFQPALEALARDGVTVFVELGAHPVLLHDIGTTLEAIGAPHVAVGSLRRDRPARESLHRSVAGLYQAGLDVRWDAVVGRPARRVNLPLYPWQRRRHWLDVHGGTPPAVAASAPAAVAGQDAAPAPAPAPVEVEVEATIAYLQRRVADALDLSDPAGIGRDAQLEELAMSSLMIVELKNQIERDFLVTVPLQALLAGGTVEDIAQRLAGGFAAGGSRPGTGSGRAPLGRGA